MCDSIRAFAKIHGDPYYEPTIVVHDIVYVSIYTMIKRQLTVHRSLTMCPVAILLMQTNYRLTTLIQAAI